jgi:hypothetical protein
MKLGRRLVLNTLKFLRVHDVKGFLDEILVARSSIALIFIFLSIIQEIVKYVFLEAVFIADLVVRGHWYGIQHREAGNLHRLTGFTLLSEHR